MSFTDHQWKFLDKFQCECKPNWYQYSKLLYITDNVSISICNWISKSVLNCSRTEIQFIAEQLYLRFCATYKLQTHGYIWPSLLSLMAFFEPMEPVNGINKDVGSVILLWATVLAYPVDWDCFCHLLKIQHCCFCPTGRYNSPSAAHPSPSFTQPLSPAHPHICTAHDIIVTVKKVAQNPAVLAS